MSSTQDTNGWEVVGNKEKTKKRDGKRHKNKATSQDSGPSNGKAALQDISQAPIQALVDEAQGMSLGEAKADGPLSKIEEGSQAGETRYKNRTTAIEWKDDEGVPRRVQEMQKKQPEQPHQEDINANRSKVAAWLEELRSKHFPRLNNHLCTQIIDHIYHLKYDPDNADFKTTIRQTIWRAIIRPNYFWINPHTGLETGKTQPIETPSGDYLGSFELFVHCCAKRSDRVGRDLPDPEYVQKVEHELRGLFKEVEDQDMGDQLQHLAFLLMFEECKLGKPVILGLEEFQERVLMAFADVEMEWDAMEIIRGGTRKRRFQPDASIDVADDIWWRAVWEFEP